MLHSESTKGINKIQVNAYAMKKKENNGCCCIHCFRFLEVDVDGLDFNDVFMKTNLSVLKNQLLIVWNTQS